MVLVSSAQRASWQGEALPYPQSGQLSPSPAAPASQPSLLSCAFPLLPWGLRILPSPACPRHPHRAKAAWILLPSFPQAKNAQGSPREELFQNSPTLCITTQGIRGTGQGIRGPERANDLPGVIQLTSSRHPTPGLPRPTLELIAAHTGSHDHTHKTQAHRGWRSCRCTCASRPGTQPLARHLPLSGSLPPQSIPNLPKPAPSADAFRFRQSGWLETLQPGLLCLGLRPLTLLHFTTGLSASVPPTSGAVSPSVLAAVLGTGGGWQQPCSLPTGCL